MVLAANWNVNCEGGRVKKMTTFKNRGQPDAFFPFISLGGNRCIWLNVSIWSFLFLGTSRAKTCNFSYKAGMLDWNTIPGLSNLSPSEALDSKHTICYLWEHHWAVWLKGADWEQVVFTCLPLSICFLSSSWGQCLLVCPILTKSLLLFGTVWPRSLVISLSCPKSSICFHEV